MKNLFKFSVGAFVLLGSSANLDPSHAGKNPFKKIFSSHGEDKEVKRLRPERSLQSEETSSELPYILTPFKGSPPTFEENRAPKSKKKRVRKFKIEPVYEGTIFPGLPVEVGEQILMLLDSRTTVNAAQFVCKDWYRQISAAQHTLLNRLQHLNKEERKKDSEFLRNLFFHPTTLASGHEALALIYFDRVLMPRSSQVEETNEKGVEVSQPMSGPGALEIINNYISVIRNSPDLHPFLGRLFVHFNPCKNFKATALAAYAIKKTPALQMFLWGVIDERPFDIDAFPRLSKNPENYLPLEQHLMALKLLGMSGDENALLRMNEFAEKLYSYLGTIPLNDYKRMEKYLKKENPHLLTHPFWAAYTRAPEAYDAQTNLLFSLMHSSRAGELNPEAIINFRDYLFVLDSKNHEGLGAVFHKGLKNVYSLQESSLKKHPFKSSSSKKPPKDKKKKKAER